MLAPILLLFILGGCATDRGSQDASELEPTVILVSLDGFRWDYVDRYETPALDRMAREGVRARRLVPIFPSKTFPNHYSAVTGLYADRHGIISNTMEDPELEGRFSLSNRDAVTDGRWWDGEPIWVTAEHQGHIAATYFWPGSEAAIQGVRPSHWFEFDASVPADDRVDQVFSWLEHPTDERPTFITLYFSELDVAGHDYGPDAPETAAAVRSVDAHVGRLMDGLEARALLDDVHLIVISDHGMVARSPERVIVLDDYFDTSEAHIIDYSPILMMDPAEGQETATYNALKEAPHMDVYWKDELPERYHLDHPRTPALIAVAEAGWSLATRDRYESSPDAFTGGTHGYDNLAPSMAGLFAARGPSFRPGVAIDSLEIIQLYELMCGILGLDPAPNDGNPALLAPLLINETSPEHVEN